MNHHTHTIVVTLGRRDHSGSYMNAAEWTEAKRSVLHSLEINGASIIQAPQMGKMRAHDQVGEWEGQRENACAFVALISGYHNIAVVRSMLATDALIYGQTCIGCIVTIGTDHLVYADG